MSQINKNLSQFNENDYTIKLLTSIYDIVPVDVNFKFYQTFEEGLERINSNLSEQDIEKAKDKLNDEKIQSTLNAFSYIDTSDKLIAGYAGLKNILNLFSSSGSKKRIFESDPQQALDAGIKGFLILYAINHLYSGDFNSKINKFKTTPAGIEILIYYTLVEIALPFTDNLIEGSVNVISKLFQNQGDIQSKFQSLGIADNLLEISNMNSLKDSLAIYLDKVKSYVNPVSQKIKEYLPSIMNITDSFTGAIATGVDLLPVWTLLGSRLVTESIAIELFN